MIALAPRAASGQPTPAQATPASTPTLPVSAASALWGLPLAASAAWVRAAHARAGIACAPQCDGGLRAPPLPGLPAYKFDGQGRLAAASWTGTQVPATFEEGRDAYGAWEGWITEALGMVAARTPLPESFLRSTDLTRLALIREGHAGLESLWGTSDGVVRLRWRGKGALVVDLELSSRACNAENLSAAAFALFAPDRPAERADAAARLGACRDPRATGALATRATDDSDEAVRVASLRGLGALPNAEAKEAVVALARSSQVPPTTQQEAVRTLADNADWAQLHRLATDASAPVAVSLTAAQALARSTAPLDDHALAALRARGGPSVAATVAEIARATKEAQVPQETDHPATHRGERTGQLAEGNEPPATTEELAASPAGDESEPGAESAAPGSPVSVPPVTLTPPRLLGPTDGTPLTMVAATVGGAALMRNLSLLGLDSASSQLLLGSAGAVIGFGTAWGLARFGLRPTLEQAAWFTNASAWGALAGLSTYAALGDEHPKLRYGSLVIGELAGMIAGAATAKAYTWTGPQIVFADSLVLAAGLSLAGAGRLSDTPPSYTPVAIATVPVMTGAALLAHNLTLTDADVRMLVLGATAGSFTGGFIAAGAAGAGLLDDRHGQGGLLLGVGAGYMASALAAPFVDLSPDRWWWIAGGFAAGNALGGGATQLAMGAARNHDNGTLSDRDRNRWMLGAGLGGATLGLAAGALGPSLHPSASAPGMAVTGLGLGVGTSLFASWARRNGPRTAAEEAMATGSLWLGGALGAAGGVVASRWWQPSVADDATVILTTSLGASAGLGLGRTLSPHAAPGGPDAAGVYGGAALGLAGGALFAHAHTLTAPELGGGLAGLGWGTLLGSLAPTLGTAGFEANRATSGGAWLGLGLGGAVGATLAGATHASGAEVAVPTVAAGFGAGLGAATGMLVPGTSSRPIRVGVFSGTLATAVASVAAEPWLHLAQGPGASAPGLGLTLGSLGAGYGVLLGKAFDDAGTYGPTGSERARAGALLLGATAGLGTALVLSTRVAPSALDELTLWAGSGLGASAGFGLGRLASPADDTADWFALGGAGLGTAGTALFLRDHSVTPTGATAGLLGGAWGAYAGTLALAFAPARFDDDRRRQGAAALGLTTGTLGATALAQGLDAEAGDVKVGVEAALFGLALGASGGELVAPEGNRAARAAGLATSAASLGAGALWGRRLHLTEDAPAAAWTLGLSGAAFGLFDGAFVATLADPQGSPSRDRRTGGMLFGGVLGLGSGWIAGHRVDVSTPVVLSAWASTGLGALAGSGAARLAAPESGGHAQAWGALGGSLLGTSAALVAGVHQPPTSKDVAAAGLGSALGGLTGWLAPSLGRPTWSPDRRDSEAALSLGVGLGAFAGTAAERLSHAEGRTLGLITAGALDGALTGVGVGLVAGGDPRGDASSRPLRWGLLGGTLGGAVLGGAVGSQLTWPDEAGGHMAAAAALGSWSGYWAGTLGHAANDDIDEARRWGLALAGAGAGTLAASYATAKLSIDDDLVANALALDAVFAVAGGGLAAAISDRADAVATGILGAGSAGLVAGGLLHDRLEVSAQEAPQLALGLGLGAWGGALLPYLFDDSGEVKDRARMGGLFGGAATGLGLASLLSLAGDLSPGQAAILADASAAGAALGGGLGFLASDASPRFRAALAGGGTALGLGFGAVVLPHVVPERIASASALGMSLGASEALLFAWSSKPEGDGGARYGGSALVGAGLGTALGIAGASWLGEGFTSVAPAAAGFGAWGGWVGAFGSAFVNRDRAVVTGGGIAGTDLGFAVGYALVGTGLVDASDFGWLSLFGAAGTVLGAGVGAPFSSSTNPQPVLGGLAVGPLVGMGIGAWALPRLRTLRQRTTTALPAFTPDDPQAVSRTARLAVEESRGTALGWRLASVVEVTDWSPLVGAMPTPSESVAPAPFLFGVAGHLK